METIQNETPTGKIITFKGTREEIARWASSRLAEAADIARHGDRYKRHKIDFVMGQDDATNWFVSATYTRLCAGPLCTNETAEWSNYCSRCQEPKKSDLGFTQCVGDGI